MGDEGLRERKKSATRSALTAAALQLAVDRGVECVTVDDIAEQAGVSPRTFFNYFQTKEAAFVADDIDRAKRFLAAVSAAPREAPVWPLLRQTALAILTGPASSRLQLPSREQAQKELLVRRSPAVVAEVRATFAELEQELARELSSRMIPADPLLARLMGNAVVAAVRSAKETWLAADGNDDTFPDLLSSAFDVFGPAFSDHH